MAKKIVVETPKVGLTPAQVAERLREMARTRSPNSALAGDLEALAFELAGPVPLPEPEPEPEEAA